MDPNRARNTFRNQHQQSLKQRLHHPPSHHQQAPVYSSGDSDLENEALSQGLRLTAYGDCGDRDGDDSAEDHIYNQYEKIIDSRTSASSSTLSSSHHPGRTVNPDPASRATHYAESAIYKRSRGELFSFFSLFFNFKRCNSQCNNTNSSAAAATVGQKILLGLKLFGPAFTLGLSKCVCLPVLIFILSVTCSPCVNGTGISISSTFKLSVCVVVVILFSQKSPL